eukprot:scaffold9899_cov122-Isochrysis_galbana.AAC.6
MASSHYAVLGLQRDFTHEQLKKQYRLLALRYHPDRNRGDEEAAAGQFKRVQEAYSTLADPSKRSAYDLDQRMAAQTRQSRHRAPDGMPRSAAPPASWAAGRRAGDAQWTGDRDPASTMDDIFRSFAAGGMFGGGPRQAPRPAAGDPSDTNGAGRGGSGSAGRKQACRSGGSAQAPVRAARGTTGTVPMHGARGGAERSPSCGGSADDENRVDWWQVVHERVAAAAAVAVAVAAAATTAPPATAAAQAPSSSDEAELSEEEPTGSRVEDSHRGGNGETPNERARDGGPVAARLRRARSRSGGTEGGQQPEWDGLEEALAASAADAHAEAKHPGQTRAEEEAVAAAEAAATEASEIDEAVSAPTRLAPDAVRLVEEAIWREQQEALEFALAASATAAVDDDSHTGCTDDSANTRDAAPAAPFSLFGRVFGLASADAGAYGGRAAPRDHGGSAGAGSVDDRAGPAGTSTVGDAQLAALLELGFAPEGLAPFCDGVSPVEVVVERVMAAEPKAPD